MRVKHLIRELQKCNPEADAIMSISGFNSKFDHRTLYSTYKLSIGGVTESRVFLETCDLLSDYHTMDDTPFPLPEKQTDLGVIEDE